MESSALNYLRNWAGFWLVMILMSQSVFAEEAMQQQQQIRAEVCSGCHQKQYEIMKSGKHWIAGDSRTPVNLQECSTCHGQLEEHVLSAGHGKDEGMKAFTPKKTTMTPPEQNQVCKTCHKGSEFIHWDTSGHADADIGCVGCHRMHQEDKVLSKATQAQACYQCHTDVRLQVNKPYGHPINEQKMTCTDCHGPHGGPGDADFKTFTTNDTCYTCHAEKRGPFLWEHVPASENCNLCHTPHGSIHAGMLNRRQPHLCQSCHEPTGFGPNPLGPHARHSRLALSYRPPGSADVGPGPGGRGISRLVMGEACMNCHAKVHGTNHPSGAKFMR